MDAVDVKLIDQKALDYSEMNVADYQRERLAAFVALLHHLKMVRPPAA